MLKPKLQFPSIFVSKTPVTKQRLKSLQNILFSLYNHPESDEFREPLEYKERGLINYHVIVENPMDVFTVRKMLQARMFEYCEECLDFTQTIFENSLLYNQKTQWILALTKKCELVFHKLVKNHLPQVVFKGETHSKKQQKKTKQAQKDLQKIEACNTEADSLAGQSTHFGLHQKETQVQTNYEDQLSLSTKSQKKSQLKKKLFDLIHQASQNSLEVLYIMTKNENINAISTERNGNCAIDVEKLSNNFIIKITAFLKNQILRAKQLESKQKNKKPKVKLQTLSRYDI